jgi:3-oxoacyl-[acyl-carrier-protein] synthase-3
MGVYIRHTEYYLPKRIVSNKELAVAHPEWDVEKVGQKSGVLKRHISGPNETAFDLAVKSVEKLFVNNEIEKGEISGIIFCTQSPDYIMPQNSFLLHKQFDFSQDVWAFDYSLACSGFVLGVSMARGMIETGLAENILLITADTYSKYINTNDRSTNILFGDGAAATVISKCNIDRVLDVKISSNGKKFDTFYIPAGGSKFPKDETTCINTIDRSGNIKSLENIHMNGFAVWQFIAKNVSEQISGLLEKNNLEVKNIDLFLFHQASKLTLDSLVKMLKIDQEKTFTNLENIGNTVSASIPIALKDAEDSGRLKRGDLILISGFGVGLSWGSIIMKY